MSSRGTRHPSTCSVWWADLQPAQRLIRLLSPAEQRRVAGLGPRTDRRRTVTAKALLRAVLAERFRRPPTSFVIEANCRVCGSKKHGRPVVPELGVSVSISHGVDRVGVAVAPKRFVGSDMESAIGIDIESTRGGPEVNIRELAEIGLGQAERQELQAMPREHRQAAVLTWWTRKEAILKATGWGLAIAPNLLEVTGGCGNPARIRWASEALHLLEKPPVAHLYELQPGRGYVGSLASIGGPVTPTQLDGDTVLVDAVATAGGNIAHDDSNWS